MPLVGGEEEGLEALVDFRRRSGEGNFPLSEVVGVVAAVVVVDAAAAVVVGAACVVVLRVLTEILRHPRDDAGDAPGDDFDGGIRGGRGEGE